MLLVLIWIAPVVLFAALVAGRWLGILPAALVALGALLAVVIGAGPQDLTAGQIAAILLSGIWIALPAVVVILAGLFFTEVNVVADSGEAISSTTDNPVRQLGTTCLFAGPFVETATGFGVGFVVALRAIVGLRVAAGPAIALAAFSQCLVPWGALGVGTRISAAIVEMPIGEITWRASIIMAPVLVLLGPLFWWVLKAAGRSVPTIQKFEDLACLAAVAALLMIANLALPIELAGMAAIGPVLMFRFWRERGSAALIDRSTVAAVAPYAALIALLCLTRLVPVVTDTLGAISATPGAGAPAFAPLLSPAVPLMVVSLFVVMGRARPIDCLTGSAAGTFRKGWRACCLTFVLVAFAWLLVRSGITAEIVRELATIGPFTSISVPLLGAFGGYLTGSNTGAGSLSMPVAAVVSLERGDVLWLAAAAIVSGSLMTTVSPVRVAMAQALASASNRDVSGALRLLTPYIGLALMAGALPVVILKIGLFG